MDSALLNASHLRSMRDPVECPACGARTVEAVGDYSDPFAALLCPACERRNIGEQLTTLLKLGPKGAVRAGVLEGGLNAKRRKRGKVKRLRRELARLGQLRYAYTLDAKQRRVLARDYRVHRMPF
jgi:hypothetical protein